jgi:hypothetical protein
MHKLEKNKLKLYLRIKWTNVNKNETGLWLIKRILLKINISSCLLYEKRRWKKPLIKKRIT